MGVQNFWEKKKVLSADPFIIINRTCLVLKKFLVMSYVHKISCPFFLSKKCRVFLLMQRGKQENWEKAEFESYRYIIMIDAIHASSNLNIAIVQKRKMEKKKKTHVFRNIQTTPKGFVWIG